MAGFGSGPKADYSAPRLRAGGVARTKRHGAEARLATLRRTPKEVEEGTAESIAGRPLGDQRWQVIHGPNPQCKHKMDAPQPLETVVQ